MAKTASLNVRIDPEVKAQAMEVFDELGISASSAINMMLKSVAIRRRLPSEVVSITDYGIIDGTNMTDDELVELVNESIDNAAGNYISLNEFRKRLNNKLGTNL